MTSNNSLDKSSDEQIILQVNLQKSWLSEEHLSVKFSGMRDW